MSAVDIEVAGVIFFHHMDQHCGLRYLWYVVVVRVKFALPF